MLDYYRDLAEQLAAMPGGHASLREAYFGGLTLPDPISGNIFPSREIIEGWMLQDGDAIALVSNEKDDTSLLWLRKGDEEVIADFSGELQEAARECGITLLGLALLALAMGGVDDSRLKIMLPALYKAAKGLLLIAVCRLCG
ncbi:MAG: hypothetical protein KKH74_07115 [Gammaproteobacteria bacterium]|nr:hypothetical protein [Gammaproteobacteria bacterium]MBU1732407.1 hypothetical protein [Gammaproteobacteria bacterium]MBU1893977.1 hypothetical protein [Gammaproteobacteria bacterium]